MLTYTVEAVDSYGGSACVSAGSLDLVRHSYESAKDEAWGFDGADITAWSLGRRVASMSIGVDEPFPDDAALVAAGLLPPPEEQPEHHMTCTPAKVCVRRGK